LEVDAKGNGTISFAAPDMTLSDGPNSLFHSGGTALVIHSNADDNKTDPSGNAGARIACGVIEKA
jgi:superoxide dismutase, Cu-Zn family